MRAAAATLRLLPRVAATLPRIAPASPHWRRRLIAAGLLLVVLAATYLFWFRDSSLVKVERVGVSGLSADSPDADQVRQKLTLAARDMTTLHVDEAALRRAVADEPSVQSLSVQADFPHALRISIVENRPVAILVAGGDEVAVAPDGSVLKGAEADGGLPTVKVSYLPEGSRMAAGSARYLVAVAAAAPPRLLPRVTSISIENGRGAVAQLQHGPPVIFGRTTELKAKWLAAAGVLARPESQGATYIDVRLPDRPVAGGLGLEQDPQPEAEGGSGGEPGAILAEPGGAPTDPTGAAPDTATGAAPDTATGAAPDTATGAAPDTAADPSVPPAETGAGAAPTTSTEAQP